MKCLKQIMSFVRPIPFGVDLHSLIGQRVVVLEPRDHRMWFTGNAALQP